MAEGSPSSFGTGDLGAVFYSVEARFDNLERQLEEFEARTDRAIKLHLDIADGELSRIRGMIESSLQNIPITLDLSGVQAQIAGISGSGNGAPSTPAGTMQMAIGDGGVVGGVTTGSRMISHGFPGGGGAVTSSGIPLAGITPLELASGGSAAIVGAGSIPLFSDPYEINRIGGYTLNPNAGPGEHASMGSRSAIPLPSGVDPYELASGGSAAASAPGIPLAGADPYRLAPLPGLEEYGLGRLLPVGATAPQVPTFGQVIPTVAEGAGGGFMAGAMAGLNSGGGALGQNVRATAALYLGIRGIEGASEALSDRQDFNDISQEGNQDRAGKEMIAKIKQEQHIFFGLPSLIRSAGERLSGGETATTHLEELQQAIRQDEAIQKSIHQQQHISQMEDHLGLNDKYGAASILGGIEGRLVVGEATHGLQRDLAQIQYGLSRETGTINERFDAAMRAPGRTSEEGNKIEAARDRAIAAAERNAELEEQEAHLKEQRVNREAQFNVQMFGLRTRGAMGESVGMESAAARFGLDRANLQAHPYGYQEMEELESRFSFDALQANIQEGDILTRRQSAALAARGGNDAMQMALSGNALGSRLSRLKTEEDVSFNHLAEQHLQGEDYMRARHEIERTYNLGVEGAVRDDKLRSVGHRAEEDRITELGIGASRGAEAQRIAETIDRSLRAMEVDRLHHDPAQRDRDRRLGVAELQDMQAHLFQGSARQFDPRFEGGSGGGGNDRQTDLLQQIRDGIEKLNAGATFQ